MSCYIVSDETISVIAKALAEYDIGIQPSGVELTSEQLVFTNLRCQPIGEWLLEQNVKSFCYRYDEEMPMPKFKYQDIEADEGTLLGCIECYEYQSCDTEDYETSEIHRWLTRLKDKMLKRLIEQKGQEIRWGI